MTSASTYSESPELFPADDSTTPSPMAKTDGGPAGAVPVTTSASTVTAKLHGRQPALDQVQVAMSQVALRQIEGHSASDLNQELGGVLLGQVIHEDEAILVKIMATLPVRTDDHGPVHFTFTADAWAQLHEDRAARYPELDIVGWFHTHPNLGVFYSADDVIVHSAAFVMPWQIGLVIDPIRGECCLVGWRSKQDETEESKLMGIDGYYELLDEQETSVVNWRQLDSSIWQKEGYPRSNNDISSQVFAPANDWLLLPAISPWWGVLLGGLSLLITLLLLLDRLLTGAN